ncbi:transglutaminaseTgpA domain-containing protein [Nocardioides sp.]|uniref:transglutaminase family protein n=1 Tax=Nocardioides sp. TaxID=35761 RepID=UPI0037842925
MIRPSTRSRGSAGTAVGLPAVAAATVWIAMYSWRGFTETPGGFLNPLFLLAIVVAGTGATLRWWRVPTGLVVLSEVVASGVVAMLLITGSPLPVGDGWTELRQALSGSLDSAQGYAAPVPDSAPSVDPLLILCGLLCLLLVDLLACTLRRVPLAGLPLLAIYSIPIGMVGDSISWWVFAATAAGFLTMLFLQESDHVARWGRPIGIDRETGDPIAFGAGTHVVRSTAGTVGGVATALAIFLPALVPTAGVHLFDFGPGGGGGDEITVDNPTADLVRDLKRGDDTPLVQITTTDPDPSYFRILTLTRFSDVEWSPGNRDVPADQRANGTMPPLDGVAAAVGRHEVPYDVTILPAFSSTWLPTQSPISRIDAEGDWRYDTQTMDFLAVPDDLTTSNLHYTMSALDLDLTSARLENAGTSAGDVSEVFTDVPADLPEIVRELAVDVTKDATTRFDKAVALQDWFREDGGFEYSLDTAEGSGYDALVDFLTDAPGGRTGYCEQFAASMAVMARVLGIPARVAIGFLHPQPAGPDTWVYSSDDMHAWPELYFDGAGWVRFEPTPSDRAEDVPDYTVLTNTPDLQPTNPSEPSGARSSLLPSNRPTEERPDSTGAAAPVNDGSGPWWPLGGALVGLCLVALALLTPRVVRRRRRDRRLATGEPEAAWAELRDTALDLGVPWPERRSPRATRNALVDHLGVPLGPQTGDRPAHGPMVAPAAVAALDRLVHALELLRYARPGEAGSDPERVRTDTEILVASLLGGAVRSARRRAAWWPRSVLRAARRRPRVAPTTVEARYGGVVDHAS